jgi:hypothetical protein
VLAKIHHASGCLEIKDHSRTNHFLAGREVHKAGPLRAASVGEWLMHERTNDARPDRGKRNNFLPECRISAKRTLVGSEVNHDGMIQGGIPETGCITLGDALFLTYSVSCQRR